MNNLKLFILTIFIVYSNIITPQEWIRVYGDDISCYPRSLIETYDKGYLYGGKINDNSQTSPKFGWIFKTDINGEMLWDKKIGDNDYISSVHELEQTADNGLILIGSTKQFDDTYDPFVLKLNSCGEKEWCRIFHLPGKTSYGSYITQLPNQNIVCSIKKYSYNPDERLWLVCLDESGEMLWKKVYGVEDVYLNSEKANDIVITPDSDILITGDAYYPDLPDTSSYITRTYLIKTDPNGNEKWSLVWGADDQFYGWAHQSVVSLRGTIYSVGKHISYAPIPGEYPTLLKTSKTGEEVIHYDITDNVSIGRSSTITWYVDSTLVIGTGWKSIYDEFVRPIVQYDTNGNIINYRDLGEDIYLFKSGVKTFDDKFLITSAKIIDGNYDIYAWKFNQDFEYDSIYTQPFVYDSLCPYQIVSDTIPLDCVIVGMEEEKQDTQASLKIIPNPATAKVKILLPEYIVTQSQLSGMHSTTWRYNYSTESMMQIFDVWGAIVMEQAVAEGQKEVEVNLNSIAAGIYIARVVLEGRVVSGKFVVK